MTRLFLIAIVGCLCCAPGDPSHDLDKSSSIAPVTVEAEVTDQETQCEPATETASVVPEQDPQDFRFRISPEGRPLPDTPARPADEVIAQYTRAAIQNRVQGIVIVEAAVRADGSVAGARVLKGLPCGLEAKALEAIENTKFVPGSVDGEPIDSVAIVPVKFNLPAR